MSSSATARRPSATKRSTSCSSGRATFELDGDTLDAPAGTIVYLSDPTVRRYATAAEPGTTVLAVGGRPGEAYTPSAWEWYFEAERFRDPFDPEAALRLMAEANERFPDHVGVVYSTACWEALDATTRRRVGDAPTGDRARPPHARVGRERRGPRLDPRPPLTAVSTSERGLPRGRCGGDHLPRPEAGFAGREANLAPAAATVKEGLVGNHGFPHAQPPGVMR